jgi:hypothetical protein
MAYYNPPQCLRVIISKGAKANKHAEGVMRHTVRKIGKDKECRESMQVNNQPNCGLLLSINLYQSAPISKYLRCYELNKLRLSPSNLHESLLISNAFPLKPDELNKLNKPAQSPSCLPSLPNLHESLSCLRSPLNLYESLPNLYESLFYLPPPPPHRDIFSLLQIKDCVNFCL